MKIQLVSDLHLEWGEPRDLTKYNADIMIVAGDVANGTSTKLAGGWFIDMCKNYEYVLFVPGNHEYYMKSIPEIDRFWKHEKEMPDNFVYMNKDVWVHPDYHDFVFIGCTLWSSLTHDPLTAWKVTSCLNDFRVIEGMSLAVYQSLHQDHLLWLDDTLKSFNKNITPIVITHHAPNIGSLHDMYKGSDINNGFINTQMDWIFDKHPTIKYWMHGHTHQGADYMVGNTRVICNPKGYRTENPYFKEDCILEV